MEDISRSGACLRLRQSVPVGSNVLIKRPWEEITGLARYCRKDGQSYVLGIERIAKSPAQSRSLASTKAFKSETHPPAPSLVPKTTPPGPGDANLDALKISRMPVPPLSAVPSAEKNSRTSTPVPSKLINPPTDIAAGNALHQPAESRHAAAKPASRPQTSPSNERRDMPTKWLGMTFSRQKQEPANGTHATELALATAPSEVSTSINHVPANGNGKGPAGWQGDLHAPEDVYRAAGIMTPRLGYGISKIIEMMNSDHIRGLANEAKHSAIMMALDVAGISLEGVLRDAGLRQDALNDYEVSQRKSFEEHWSRIAEVNEQIQAELDRIKLQSMERIKRNLDEIATEKVQFAEWQTSKRQEAERIAEAVGLCSISSAPRQAVPSNLMFSATAPGSKSS
jgi:hypothetical protein